MTSSLTPTDSITQRAEVPSRPALRDGLWAVLVALTALYIVGVMVANRRFIWFDELFTFDIAKAKSLPEMWMLIRKFDFQLPTGFLLSRASMQLLGEGRFGLRFPSMLEFYLGSLALFFYVRRKVGIGYAAGAVLILWTGETFRYAVEARPYALLLMCFSILLFSWDIATTSEKRQVALWGVAIANLGLFAAHVFAPLTLFPFLAAEVVRFRRTRRPDLALWSALLLPTLVIALYVPLSHGYATIYFPPAFQASLAWIPKFFYHTIQPVSVALFLATFAALLATQAPERSGGVSEYKGRPEELVLLGCFLLNPILLNILLMQKHGAFWDRYAISTQVVIYISLAIMLALRLRSNRLAGYAAATVLLFMFIVHAVVGPMLLKTSQQNASMLESIRPELPLVDAHGVTFFEMNHHETQALLSRVYFLKDRSLAMQYTHTNLFEDRGFGDGMKSYFPITANVASYADFVGQHRQFLVLGTYDAPEEWVLRKLKDDGAQLTWLGTYPLPYVDTNLYLVNLPADK